jgi:hypothetical protein
MKKAFTSGLLPMVLIQSYHIGVEYKKKIKIYFLILFNALISYSSIHAQDWQFLGLENENITAIAVDWSNPDIIYAGSISNFSAGTVGGIFKSINAGADWDTLIRGVTVRDLDIDPQNPEILYSALGLNVLTQPGIIKTTDAGATWFGADNGIYITWEEGPGVLEINPQYPEILYAGTGGPFGGAPYKSTNGGESWFRIDPDSLWIWMLTLCGDSIYVNGYPLLSSITAIAIDPVNTEIIYLGTTELSFKSTNGGVDWIATCLTNNGLIDDIKILPSNTDIL